MGNYISWPVTQARISSQIWSFDLDVASLSPLITGATDPNITPAAAGELLYATVAVSSVVSAPTADATQGLWTGAAGGITGGDMSEYIVNGSASATVIDFVGSGLLSGIIAAFKASSGTTTAHVQGAAGSPVITLGVNPTPGNIVVCGFVQYVTTGNITSILDGNNNAYTLTTNSPAPIQVSGGAGRAWIAYLLNAPANAEKTITATWDGGSASQFGWADEFARS